MLLFRHLPFIFLGPLREARGQDINAIQCFMTQNMQRFYANHLIIHIFYMLVGDQSFLEYNITKKRHFKNKIKTEIMFARLS